jgi:hypothetical protein
VLAVASLACAPHPADTNTDSTWVGTITTEGGVTSVFNESGSVWRDNATVVEAVSIGVEAGPDELMFGEIAWVYEAGETIYVIDPQVPAVRTFDLDGNFLGNLGGPGQGPGEYTDPFRLVAAPDGRLFLSQPRVARIDVYAADGTPLDMWTVRMPTGFSMVVDEEGVLWVPIVAYSDGGAEYRQGIQALPDGEPGERALIEQFDGEAVPPRGAQGVVWTPAGGGTLIVGVGIDELDSYRFEVQRLGKTVLLVERGWEPLPVDPEYAAWYLAATGDERPTTYPAYLAFTKAASGEIWVTRHGPTERLPDCEADLSSTEAARANPCWRRTWIVDVFGEDGRYLGEIDLPDDITPVPQWIHVDGDMLIARSQQDDGVVRVKRFRIVLPEG